MGVDTTDGTTRWSRDVPAGQVEFGRLDDLVLAPSTDRLLAIDATTGEVRWETDLSGSLDLAPKKYDLMQDVNVRGTFMLSRAAVPLLREGDNPHILSLSPPLNPTPRWLGAHTGYTLSKFGMTMVTLGLAAEFARDSRSSRGKCVITRSPARTSTRHIASQTALRSPALKSAKYRT